MAGPEVCAHPWIWGGVKPTANRIASGQNGVLLTDPGEMEARQAKQQVCTAKFQESKLLEDIFHSYLPFAMEAM